MNISGIGTKLIGKIKERQGDVEDSTEDPAASSCKMCGMEFSDSERLYRHMVKAHSRPMGQRKNKRQKR